MLAKPWMYIVTKINNYTSRYLSLKNAEYERLLQEERNLQYICDIYACDEKTGRKLLKSKG